MPLEGRCKRAPAFVRGEGPMGPVRSGGRQTHAATPDGPDPSRADLDAGRSPQRCTNDQTSACSRHPRGRHRAGRLLPGSVTHADLRGWRRPPHTDREPDGERSTRFLSLLRRASVARATRCKRAPRSSSPTSALFSAQRPGPGYTSGGPDRCPDRPSLLARGPSLYPFRASDSGAGTTTTEPCTVSPAPVAK